MTQHAELCARLEKIAVWLEAYDGNMFQWDAEANDIREAIAALQSTEQRVPMVPPSFWVLESSIAPMYWDGRFLSRGIDPRHFITDINLAVKFASKADAEKVAWSGSSVIATEHMFIGNVLTTPAEKRADSGISEREAFSSWYDSLPYGEPSYQETFEAGVAFGRAEPVPMTDKRDHVARALDIAHKQNSSLYGIKPKGE